MRLKKIANNVALQTIGYCLRATENINVCAITPSGNEVGVYYGLYRDFFREELYKYANCKVVGIRAIGNVLYIFIER